MTKQERRDRYYDMWLRSSYYSVTEYYNNPSETKQEVELIIKRHMIQEKGRRYRVLCGNCFCFTCAYTYPKDNKWYLKVVSKGNCYDFELTEEESLYAK